MGNFTIDRRKNWVARFTLCETEDSPPIAARTVVQRLASNTEVFAPRSGVSLQDDYIALRTETGYVVAGSGFHRTSIAINAGVDPFVRVSRVVASTILSVPQGRFATVLTPSPETGAATTVVGDEIRVVFPYGITATLGYRELYSYKVLLANQILVSGIVTVIIHSEEDDDPPDDPPDSSFTVCAFNVGAA